MPQGPQMVANYDDFAPSSIALSGDVLLKTAAAKVRKVSINTIGTATGSPSVVFYDTNTSGTAGTAAARLACVVPNTLGIYVLNWPFNTGVRAVVAGGGVISVTLA